MSSNQGYGGFGGQNSYGQGAAAATQNPASAGGGQYSLLRSQFGGIGMQESGTRVASYGGVMGAEGNATVM